VRGRTATVAADSCVVANTASTAALVAGEDAVDRLVRAGLPARLVAVDGSVITLGAWPRAVA
jgi:thiamine biosynthesis lipoprotein